MYLILCTQLNGDGSNKNLKKTLKKEIYYIVLFSKLDIVSP